ncbi:rhodanese-like domain-containing protein [Shewanella atlantica]|uniref:Sulfurtransferase n=1 Tax=Shewanella atlantica TaxID=271099 RepID=A0A431WD74_9GAMM|nr:rhodanese-like domain-containing protein [Shewanella atlantica]RTR33463.1 sulfurtransferase [Shewanella atlantica]
MKLQRYWIGLLSLIMSCLLAPVLATEPQAEQVDANFPLRSIYKDIPIIDHHTLYKQLESTLVIDVRSQYEYDTLHIKGAINISISNAGFITRVKKLRAQDSRPIVFYCNGITCEKSYKASDKAIKNGITNVATMDLGIFGWIEAFPDAAVILGEETVPKDRLITNEKYQLHLLSPGEFVAKIDKSVMVIDIREHYHRDPVILEGVTRVASSDKVFGLLRKAKKNQQTILFYDAVGKQTPWLQYLIEKVGVENYYFMDGGVKAYVEAGLPMD